MCKSKHNFILDGEIVYVDKTGKFLPFQAIERKLQIEGVEALQDYYIKGKAPKLFVFDILAKDEKSLCHLPWHERRKYLIDTIDAIGCLKLEKLERVIEVASTFKLDG